MDLADLNSIFSYLKSNFLLDLLLLLYRVLFIYSLFNSSKEFISSSLLAINSRTFLLICCGISKMCIVLNLFCSSIDSIMLIRYFCS
ncbi:hypothetical protein C1645_791373 [Glomus cerebriforme]|uniref:Uncharacterized protein n=1 Tax=Glomus cerebriforme TaxID=658196 RepID=A0A397S9P0_9GLOM|nr:hypothetical protein C1645_791373 [Glomus cerebriforme]